MRHYPELFAKPHNEPLVPLADDSGKLIEGVSSCTRNFIRGMCSNGHAFAKAIVCGKEWCTDCGKKESLSHQRRIARWWGKVMQTNYMGYLVVTVPKELRDAFKDRKVLSDFRTYNKRKLQRFGYKRGLIRYHYAGDCQECKGKKGIVESCMLCQFTGSGHEWQPHLNILIEEGFIGKKNDFLSRYKKDIAAWFNIRFRKLLKLRAETLGLKKWQVSGNIHYSYCKPQDTPHKIHKLKYITRATFRFYNKDIATLLKKFRTSSTWGKWSKEIPSDDALINLVHDNCPTCKTKIKWQTGFYECSDCKAALTGEQYKEHFSAYGNVCTRKVHEDYCCGRFQYKRSFIDLNGFKQYNTTHIKAGFHYINLRVIQLIIFTNN